ncbi:2-oxoacid:acceptor oxidoreductase subunit alpha [Marinoscillum sp. MHG1-6]|uniref:2-oxoacid:acceptor oxidoreductase subunit alpha n=1 Tax=Marinoscillum sp. MHG1-6 TaxID=2959627 RepID=UPI002157326E|nr:2-oxoacid:acceptor oxidoreductase subunit alpha [Marinoscillum sp. MHG1-6]
MMKTAVEESKSEVVVLFAGDSGDGIQFTGGQFTETVELFGNDITTFPNFPAEIRAPQGTLSGVSGFQLQFGSVEVFTPGDQYDVLVVMNAAALKVNIDNLKRGGIIIANSSGFDSKNLKLAKYLDGENPLTDHSLDGFEVHAMDITKLTREALKDSGLSVKEVDRCKNMFVLGFIYWMFNQSVDNTVKFIGKKFAKHPEVVDANIKALKTGYHYGDTSETFTTRFKIKSASLPPGKYRNMNGNKGLSLGLIAATHLSDLNLFYASYPITPASDILHELSQHKDMGVKTFQAEDEIAAVCAAIGASFGGALGVTASSGPGIALKGEALGLATILEIPLVCINVQRGGPSTGLPTKTEQADLFQAMYGRNGEAPMVVLATSSPGDCFETAYEACRIAVEHMTPVLLLSDGYIANGAEPWAFPQSKDLKPIELRQATEQDKDENGQFLPYRRDMKLVRPWVVPGTKGFEHRIGGLEKEVETGNVSYDPANHQRMVELRADKITTIADYIPSQLFDSGDENCDILVIGWGSTFGAIETAIRDLKWQGMNVAHIHLRYLNPFPANLGQIISNFDKIIVPEINNGQLSAILRQHFDCNIIPLNKMKGLPFQVTEIKECILNELEHGH